jgi:hypothetical protein
MGDPDNLLCWLAKSHWVRVLDAIREAERKRKRRLSRPVYEKLVKSLTWRTAARSTRGHGGRLIYGARRRQRAFRAGGHNERAQLYRFLVAFRARNSARELHHRLAVGHIQRRRFPAQPDRL